MRLYPALTQALRRERERLPGEKEREKESARARASEPAGQRASEREREREREGEGKRERERLSPVFSQASRREHPSFALPLLPGFCFQFYLGKRVC